MPQLPPAAQNHKSSYLQQKRFSPTGIAIVVVMHAAGLGVLLLAKPEIVTSVIGDPPQAEWIALDPPPPPPPGRPETPIEHQLPVMPAETVIDIPRPALPPIAPTPFVPFDRLAEVVPPAPPLSPPAPPPREPVLTNARFAQSAMAHLQPPYPSAMIRQGVEGEVTVRVRVGTDGRVTAVERVRAVHETLFEATRQHALRRWRFVPATRDGEPVESWQTHTIRFRIA